MSITLAEFDQKMVPVLEEISALNARSNELHDIFVNLANSIEVGDDEEDEFRDKMFEIAEYFIDNIDHEHSEVEPGNVDIWQSSTC